GTSAAAPGIELQPSTRDRGGRAVSARGDRPPALLAPSGPRPLRQAPTSDRSQVPAAPPRKLRLPVAGAAAHAARRARLVRAAASPRRGGLRQALLRRERLRLPPDVHAPSARSPTSE